MPEKGYFSKMGVYALTGLVAIIITGVIFAGLFFLFAPVAGLVVAAISGIFFSILILFALVVFIFSIVYLLIYVGVFIDYWKKPMVAKPGTYSIKSSKESGKRSKGISKNKKTSKKPKK